MSDERLGLDADGPGTLEWWAQWRADVGADLLGGYATLVTDVVRIPLGDESSAFAAGS